MVGKSAGLRTVDSERTLDDAIKIFQKIQVSGFGCLFVPIPPGDHSQEALKELLEAMAAARNVGEESLDEAWDVFRDGLWEETVESYEDYKANPDKDNRTELIENLETVRQVDPPDGKQEEFNRMLEDIFGDSKNDLSLL